MKKLSLFAGSAVAIAVAVFYFRPDSISTPPVEAHLLQAATVTSTSVVKHKTQKKLNEAEKPQHFSLAPKSTPSAVPSTQVDSSDDFPLPEPLIEEGTAHSSEIELWQLPEGESDSIIDDLPAVNFAMDPKALERLQVGQVVRLQLPDGEGEVEAEIVTTYNDPAGVQVWTGKIKNDANQASIIFTRGQIQTHIVIASTQGNYSAVIDNHSGDGTLINESTIHSRQLPYDDGIVYRPGDTETTHQH